MDNLANIPVIDVDTNFVEPVDLWTSLSPSSLKDLVPRVETDKNGNQI